MLIRGVGGSKMGLKCAYVIFEWSLRSNSGVGLTEEEAEMLAAIKTEKLKDDADASKGFVISFDSDTPKKPKPQLKTRR